MPRMPSAASFKGWKSGHRQDEPRPGTIIRSMYDTLVNHPGVPVPIDTVNQHSRRPLLNQLQDIYGLDIRLWRQGSKFRGPTLYVLVGRWDGDQYQDFLTPQQLEELRRGAFMSERE